MPVSRSSYALLLAALLSLTACSVEMKSDGDKPGALKKREKVRVRTALVEQREMVRTLSTTTVVESEHEIMIFPRASGQVIELRCEEGDRVTAGTVLAVLDRRTTTALLEEAKIAVREAEDNVRKADLQRSESESRIEAAQIRFDSAVRDFERNEKAALISAQALDNLRVARDSTKNELDTVKLATQRADVESKAARTALEKSKLALERATLDDSFMQVTAAFDGVIAKRTVKVGDSVSPSASMFVLTDTHNLRAVFYRPQRELALFLAADKAKNDGALAITSPLEIRVIAEALPDVVFAGELQIVSPSIDPQSGSFRVTVKLGPPLSGDSGAKLLPGMLVRLEVVTERHPAALVLPKRALRREGEQNLVFAVEDGKAKKIEVTEGFSDDLFVEVKGTVETLKPGLHVIVVGNRELEDGAEVIEDSVESDPKKD